ncbi:MAG: hypothetical protein JWQ02_2079 [Capsulimonas sp.]|nr:hypothetical protein [Capsulimonas sp.]
MACDEEPDLPGEHGAPEDRNPRGLGPASPFLDAASGGEKIEEGGEAAENEERKVLKDQHQKCGFAEGEGPAFIGATLTLAVPFAHWEAPFASIGRAIPAARGRRARCRILYSQNEIASPVSVRILVQH